MKLLGVFAAIVIAAFCFLIVWNDPAVVQRREAAAFTASQREYARVERDLARAERAEEREQWQHQIDAIGIPVTRIVTTSVTVALLIAVPVSITLVLVGATAFARRRHSLVYADGAGRFPVQLDHAAYQQIAAAAIAAYHQTEQERARASQTLPLHYSPTLTYAPHSKGVPEPVQLATGGYTEAPRPELTTFADLLSQGRIGKGQPLLLGIDSTGQPVEGSWLDLFSVGIGGLSGSGKSWTGTCLLAQAMLHGARVALLDPHAGDSESISSRLAPVQSGFLCDVASDSAAMLATVKLFTDEIARRKEPGSSRDAWIIVADEFSSLMRGELAEPLSLLFEAIAQEGRKLWVYGMALGQVWTASRAGGSELRDSLASAYIHRLRPAQARYLTGLTADDLPKDLLELPAGTAYLLSTRGDLRRVTMPRMASTDLRQVARLITGMPPGRPQDATNEQASTASERDKTHSPDQARAIALFLGGMEVKDVVRTMYGDLHSGSREYRERRSHVETWLREGLA